MIVERRTHKVKQGCVQELVALLKGSAESRGLTVRIYIDNIGPRFTVAVETEFDSLAEREKLRAERRASPDLPASLGKYFALTETGGTIEIWDLVE
ncbi:unnamed protein product [marine sediment metagenome]|uniref:ABM domain-containing protein n=1 Tax=marine sediment metagenome TaxID=412755 RepID=X0VHX0_9ZZZZ